MDQLAAQSDESSLAYALYCRHDGAQYVQEVGVFALREEAAEARRRSELAGGAEWHCWVVPRLNPPY
jgi:hypothetical protein